MPHAKEWVLSEPAGTSKLRTPGHGPRAVKGARDRVDARFSSSAIWTGISSRTTNRRHVKGAQLNAAVERNLSCAPPSTLPQALHTA